MSVAARLRNASKRGKAPDAEEPSLDLDAPPESPRGPKPALIAAAILVLMLGGTVLWLSLSARETVEELNAAVPRVVVPIAGTAPQQAAPPPSATPAPSSSRQAAAEQPSRPAPQLTPNQLAASQTPDKAPPPQPVDVVLTPAPVAALVEQTPQGPLPRVAEDGRTPWQTYARPFVHEDTRPRIALVMVDLGLSTTITRHAVEALPGAVTFAFAPQVPDLQAQIDRVRADGHEVLLNLSAEPEAFPREDPGPNSLLTSLRPDENLTRLRWQLSRATGYVGVTSLSGTRLAAQADPLRPILREVKDRGLILLDARTGNRSVATVQATEIGLPRAIGDGMVDRVPSGSAIDTELKALEELARSEKVAVGIVNPYPITLQRLQAWLPTLADKGFSLAPVTAVINKQPDR